MTNEAFVVCGQCHMRDQHKLGCSWRNLSLQPPTKPEVVDGDGWLKRGLADVASSVTPEQARRVRDNPSGFIGAAPVADREVTVNASHVAAAEGPTDNLIAPDGTMSRSWVQLVIAKAIAQGESRGFAAGRASRLSPERRAVLEGLVRTWEERAAINPIGGSADADTAAAALKEALRAT
jgi:hypothetical protein